MEDFDLSPNLFATTLLLQEALNNYPEMIAGLSPTETMAEMYRLELLGEFDQPEKSDATTDYTA